MTEVDRSRYRLDPAEHDRIFHELIVPQFLGPTTSHPDPIVIFVSGQTGSGKSASADHVHAALLERGNPVIVDLDQLKPFHPGYAELMRRDDTTAGAYTSLDGRAWMAELMAAATRARVDVLMESAMRGPAEFLEPAQLFHHAGYRVAAVILAVPAAQSRLGVLARYHAQVAATGSGRMINLDIHDGSYLGVLDCADAIDNGHAVDTVVVVRRGNSSVYENTRQPDGQWAHAPGTRAVIEAERSRPWTAAEKAEFTKTMASMRALLGPEWASELDRIEILRESSATRAAKVFDARSVVRGASRSPHQATAPPPTTPHSVVGASRVHPQRGRGRSSP